MIECKIQRISDQNELYSFSIYSDLIYVCTCVASKIVKTILDRTGEIVYSVQRKNYLGVYETLFSCTGKMIITLGEGVSEEIQAVEVTK